MLRVGRRHPHYEGSVMKTRFTGRAVRGLLAVVCAAFAIPAAGQSAPQVVRPGAPGEPGRIESARGSRTQEQPGYTEADVQFMQGMIPHHAQALEMTALVPDRSTSRTMHLLAQRIEVSQQDEIAWMQRWLEDRGEEAPDLDAHQHHHGGGHHALMPGMLTPEEMAQLAAAKGETFDQLFLQFMIRHHEGALVMVKDLFSTPGAAQASEVYRFASDVEADQRAEIQRMQAVLDAAPAAPVPTPGPTHHH